ncbi:MAG: TetR/AcrR family transcriptional regulator [Chloroflexi bacterium]|nr:TetR/AcrR family transcriptional regulator [Chloroflexota bacterium]
MVETRRQQIEDAASVLFRERGYSATSVRDIAQVLNLQGGSLYAHVASKEDVLWSIVLRAADRFDSIVRPIAEAPYLPAPERLRRMVRAHARVVTDDLGNATVFLHEWRFLGDARRAEVALRRDDYEALFRTVIADGSATGELDGADPKLAATLILSALNGIAGWYRPDGPLTAEAIAHQYADLFTRALSPTGGVDR